MVYDSNADVCIGRSVGHSVIRSVGMQLKCRNAEINKTTFIEKSIIWWNDLFDCSWKIESKGKQLYCCLTQGRSTMLFHGIYIYLFFMATTSQIARLSNTLSNGLLHRSFSYGSQTQCVLLCDCLMLLHTA